MGLKYGNIRTYSELCGRWFASKAEARRAEELRLLEKEGEIYGLEYQPRFVLCKSPKITYTADFAYNLIGDDYKGPMRQYEDVKGYMTRDTRTKIAWAQQLYGIRINIIK